MGRQRPEPSPLAKELMALDREGLKAKARELGVSAADITFSTDNGLRFIILDTANQLAVQSQ